MKYPILLELVFVTLWIPVLSFAGPPLTASVINNPEQEYSFVRLWNLVQQHSPEISAANHDLNASQSYEKRTARHWYPRVSIEAKAFSTNDPATTFMSLLGQRQIGGADFAPSVLNHPGSSVFESARVGIDFPLYEGGAQSAVSKLAEKMSKAKVFDSRAIYKQEYVNLAKCYSSLLSLQHQKEEFEKIIQSLNQTLAHYRIGTKSNPIGYSGLLGLKNLSNRLQGLLAENSAKIVAMRENIRVIAKELPTNWTLETKNVREFVDSSLQLKKSDSSGDVGVPDLIKARRYEAESLENLRVSEQAKLLPRLGLFGTGDLNSGSRSAATSFTAGAYLRWDVFSLENWGASTQAEHSAAAAQARVDVLMDRSQVETIAAAASSKAIEQSLSLMEQSSKMLEEQTAVARSLFHNGSINAMQFVEVLARRVDLLVSQAEAESTLVQSRIALYLNSRDLGVRDE